ncbi:hypothetical protein H70357_24810 [Paenibacillus sp. FSL H7-0357]|uniref:hypothetical protein n=1 Tax=Paenibacillus sp. FSL H7-0357 TaxID=1536774 RepID=UPI0004F76241|nr:hypothetical protein [Paenibacillus sp. FSL H7-0357]AIQ19569.1 hypothetical protein H70357_24810 [Paenibacillus sp. FSL H7-0357]
MAKRLDKMWEGALFTFGSVDNLITLMIKSIKEAQIKDSRIEKLLKLASCAAAPMGEKENAAKMAFKFMEPYFK